MLIFEGLFFLSKELFEHKAQTQNRAEKGQNHGPVRAVVFFIQQVAEPDAEQNGSQHLKTQ